MRTLSISLWYEDAGKHIADRALHLLRKPGVTRWEWSVRPGLDCTPQFLVAYAEHLDKNVRVRLEDLEQPRERIERLSRAGDRMLDLVEDEDFVLWHESDLFTPDDLLERLASLGAAAAGGWPTLSHDEDRLYGIDTQKRMYLTENVFYDTWGYRSAGTRFTNIAPFHDCFVPEPFRLDSVGSVVLIQAEYIRRGARMNGGGLVGLCRAIREMGGEVWCDPRVPVVQPAELWRFNDD